VHSHRGYGPSCAGAAPLLHAWLADEVAGYATHVASGGLERDAQARAEAEAARPASSIALGAAAAGRSTMVARRKAAASSSAAAAAAAGSSSMKARKRRLGELQKVAHFGPAGDSGLPSAAAAAGGSGVDDDEVDEDDEAGDVDAFAHLEQSGLDAFYYGTGREAGGNEERDRLSDFEDW
jgi:hypothetical protein